MSLEELGLIIGAIGVINAAVLAVVGYGLVGFRRIIAQLHGEDKTLVDRMNQTEKDITRLMTLEEQRAKNTDEILRRMENLQQYLERKFYEMRNK